MILLVLLQYGAFCSQNSFWTPVTLDLGADGQLTKERSAIAARWKEHFDAILNQPTTNAIVQSPVIEVLSTTSILEELRDAIKSLTLNKTLGIDGLPAEKYQYGGQAFAMKIPSVTNAESKET